jgi:hypothetical protein
MGCGCLVDTGDAGEGGVVLGKMILRDWTELFLLTGEFLLA